MGKKYLHSVKSFSFSTFSNGKIKGLFFSGGVWVTLFIFAGLFLLGFLIAKNESSRVETFKQTKILMGTVVDIQVQDSDKEKASAAIAKAFDEIKRIDDLFSSYNSESPVWKINHSKHDLTKIPNELFSLIKFSDSIWKISNGAFDVSLGSLIELWNLKSEHPILPSKEKLSENLAASGWSNVYLKNDNYISLANKTKLDFGAVAKGYAVDRAIDIIRRSGVSAALVNAGGEVKGYGKDWIVGIQHPRNKNEIISRIKLNEMSVATSGDYEQYFEYAGKRYHHILNPKTGMPAEGCQSVTIICGENKLADALATAVFVMGTEEGLKFVEKFDNVEAMIVASDGKIKSSKGFNKFLVR